MYELASATPVTGEFPTIMNGGMAVNVSHPNLAKAVNLAGEKMNINTMGVISGIALPVVMLNRIRQGDLATIREFRAFDKKFTEEIISEYIPEDGRRPTYPPKPETLVNGTPEEIKKFTKLAVAAAYVEVKLAKKNNLGPIGMNLLEKIQLMHLPTILGAMMAGVDYILMGAGIPDQIPKVLQDFSEGRTATYNMDVLSLDGKKFEKHPLTLDPKEFIGENTKLKKPLFYPIISHHLLAMMLADAVDGFVVERHVAGGHNASPRKKVYDNESKQLILEYTDKDEPDINKILGFAKGKPVYLAGGASLSEARRLGAQGIQVGSTFALTNEDESGMDPILAEKVRNKIKVTDDLTALVKPTLVSPTGFPFQVFELDGTWSDPRERAKEIRMCTLGYLVQAFLYLQKNNVTGKVKEKIGFRCPAEPVNIYTRRVDEEDGIKGRGGKGGKFQNTIGKADLCRYLTATGGLIDDTPIITMGQVLDPVKELILAHPNGKYSAENVVDYYTSQN